jgi:hypothetical protein
MEAHRCVRGRGSQIFQTLASQMAVTLSALRARRTLPPRNLPGTHFCQSLSRPQGHSAAGMISLKNPITSPGSEPATFRLLAYCLNQLRYRVPHEWNR